MRNGSCVLVLLVTACAVSDPASRDPTVERTTVDPMGSGQVITLRQDVSDGISILPHNVQSLWTVLPAVYRQVGIEPGHVDAARNALGNLDFAAIRHLGGIPLSRLVRCGLTSLGLPRENTSRINLSVVTNLSTVPEERTRVQTRVQASSRNAGTGSGPIECTSTGTLERLISEALEQRLAG
jgi:hypothetical protein